MGLLLVYIGYFGLMANPRLAPGALFLVTAAVPLHQSASIHIGRLLRRSWLYRGPIPSEQYAQQCCPEHAVQDGCTQRYQAAACQRRTLQGHRDASDQVIGQKTP